MLQSRAWALAIALLLQLALIAADDGSMNQDKPSSAPKSSKPASSVGLRYLLHASSQFPCCNSMDLLAHRHTLHCTSAVRPAETFVRFPCLCLFQAHIQPSSMGLFVSVCVSTSPVLISLLVLSSC